MSYSVLSGHFLWVCSVSTTEGITSRIKRYCEWIVCVCVKFKVGELDVQNLWNGIQKIYKLGYSNSGK